MTKERILRAVVKTYKQKGLEGLTIKSVADNAGIGKSTVYEYFDNKQQMIADSIIYSADRFVEDFYDKEWNKSDVTFEETLKESILYMIDLMKNELGDFIAFAMESSNGRLKQYIKKEKLSDLMKLTSKSIEYTWILFKKGQDEGIIRDNITTLDILNFQKILFTLGDNFTGKKPFLSTLVKDIKDPATYIYDHIVRLYS